MKAEAEAEAETETDWVSNQVFLATRAVAVQLVGALAHLVASRGS